MNIHLTREYLKMLAKQFFTAETPPGQLFFPTADAHPLILPPFGGELGFEVRSFLGQVEPWLRNGWKILARRPELYPSGTAVYDREYFAREADILRRFGCVRFGYGYWFPDSSKEKMQIAPGASLSATFAAIADGVQIPIPDVRDILLGAMFEKELRRLFSVYLLRPQRPPTVWDERLLAVTPLFDYTTFANLTNSVVPSYQPPDFLAPSFTCDPHIGVQLRARSDDPRRNSDPVRVLQLANRVAQAWNLPILIYGHPDGTFLPEGYRHTVDAGVEGLLKRELSYLSQCQLMFAPDSGWSGLMAWLRIPSLIEKTTDSHTFYWLQPFKPRMEVIQADQDIVQLAERVRSQPECLPTPNLDLELTLSPESLMALKQRFLEL